MRNVPVVSTFNVHIPNCRIIASVISTYGSETNRPFNLNRDVSRVRNGAAISNPLRNWLLILAVNVTSVLHARPVVRPQPAGTHFRLRFSHRYPVGSARQASPRWAARAFAARRRVDSALSKLRPWPSGNAWSCRSCRRTNPPDAQECSHCLVCGSGPGYPDSCSSSRPEPRMPSRRKAVHHDLRVFATQRPAEPWQPFSVVASAASTSARFVMLLLPGTVTVADGGFASGVIASSAG